MPALPRTTVAHACLMLGAMALSVAFAHPSVFSCVGLAVFALRIYWERDHWVPTGFGLANAVTVARIGLIATIGWFFDAESSTYVAILSVLILVLDGVDGWIARQLGQTSTFGAALDTESDAFLTAMMCVALWGFGIVGLWVLVSGLLRYLYVIVIWLGNLRGEAPRTQLGRYTFSILTCSLAFAFLPFPSLSGPMAALGTAFVLHSYWHSFTWLFRHGRGVQ